MSTEAEHKDVRHRNKRRTVGILRDVLVVEDKGMFNVAFFRVNGRHADDLNA